MSAILLVKASLLLSATLLASHLLRRAPAASRHKLWTLTFAAMLALPVLASALPALYVPVPFAWLAPAASQPAAILSSPAAQDPPGAVHAAGSPVEGSALRSPIPAVQESGSRFPGSARPALRTVLLAVWFGGGVAAVAALMLSLVRVRRLARGADDLDDLAWRSSADALAARLGLRRPARLFMSPMVGTPMAGGVWRPAIFLPSSARGWTTERRDVVLAHEIAHLAGHDPLRHLAARLAVALYWFHPLAWMAALEAAAAREQACDEAVLALGTRPSAYARVLMELADAIHPATATAGALPMVERSNLEARLMSILNGETRPATGRRMLIPALGGVLLTLSVAAAQPAVRASTPAAAVADSVLDGTARVAASALPAPLAAPAMTAADGGSAQTASARDSACAWDQSSGSFRGYSSSRTVGGRTVISERVGTTGGDRVIQQSFGDVRLCMVAEGTGDRSDNDRPSQWLGRARRIVMETQRGRTVQRLEMGGSGAQRISWQVNGAERAFDTTAQQWRDRMLAALDTTWELSTLRGEVSSLHGEISSIRGEESSLRGEISSLEGEVSSMHGRQSSVRGEESSLRGQISSIRGHVSSLRGAISSEQGAISSLNAGGYMTASSDRSRLAAQITKHQAEIERLEQEIRAYGADARIASVEKEIDALDADKKVSAIDADVRAFDLKGKIAAIERQITALDVDGKTDALLRQIKALDADRRGLQLEDRRDEELKRLDTAISAIR